MNLSETTKNKISKPNFHTTLEVLVDVITQGSALALKLIQEVEDAWAAEAQAPDGVEIIETTTEEYVEVVEMPYYSYDHYNPYYDPYYISPIWLVPVLLW